MLASLVATACLTTTKNGGELVDSGTDGDADDGSSETDGHTGPSGSDESGGAPSCADTPSLSCGDGVIDALEECDGTADCDACTSTLMPTTTVDVFVELIPYTVATDGTSFGMGIGSPPDISMRRYDADGELSWAYLSEFGGVVGDVAIDTSGNVYVAGSSEEIVPMDGTPWLLALDGDGFDRWSVTLPDVGYFLAIALSSDRIAVGGLDAADEADNGAIARVQVYDTAGVEQWTVVDPSLVWINDIAFVGSDVVAIGTGPGLIDQIDDTMLVRYDENGAQRWSVALPDDGLPGQRPFGVIADDADGTWSFGQAAGGPYLVHHDRDGQEIESIACIGGVIGWIEHAALSADNRLGLGLEIAGQAWFAVLDDGVVTRAATFGDPDSGNTAGPSAVQWLADGSLGAAWTEYPEEGGPGTSQLEVLSP